MLCEYVLSYHLFDKIDESDHWPAAAKAVLATSASAMHSDHEHLLSLEYRERSPASHRSSVQVRCTTTRSFACCQALAKLLLPWFRVTWAHRGIPATTKAPATNPRQSPVGHVAQERWATLQRRVLPLCVFACTASVCPATHDADRKARQVQATIAAEGFWGPIRSMWLRRSMAPGSIPTPVRTPTHGTCFQSLRVPDCWPRLVCCGASGSWWDFVRGRMCCEVMRSRSHCSHCWKGCCD